MNPYVFIVGCPRSGTTLLRRIIDAHRKIAITRETHWIAKRFEAAAGDLLEELGYERAFPHPPEETLAWAARIRESFTRDASASGKRLPKGWQR